MPIEWNADAMATGQSDIDRQHQEWLLAFNQFERVVREDKGLESIQGALNFFVRYAERHFVLEEARMDQLHCPTAEANRTEHARFRQMIAALQKSLRYQDTNHDHVIALQIELANWLMEHILTVDLGLRLV
jgi:hemerythrin-like metal-binding protein